MTRKDIDEISGTETTGHQWDGIKELNNPLPRWWILTFYATVLWAIGYWIVYPSWPLLTDYTRGLFGWSSRAAVSEAVAELKAMRKPFEEALLKADLDSIKSDPKLLRFATKGGEIAFRENCAACHGFDATGVQGKGYPNLVDDDWLWGGTLEDILYTIRYGIRADHEETRSNDMPAFGKDGILDEKQIRDVAGYVLSLSGKSVPGADLAKGKEIFAENCAACHGEDAKGLKEMGAPNLTDDIWLYGGDVDTVIETITNSRRGVMPSWEGRLSPATIKALAVYIHTRGGGQ